jgi:hypothetical protein
MEQLGQTMEGTAFSVRQRPEGSEQRMAGRPFGFVLETDSGSKAGLGRRLG